jgi:hypothetical protein
MVISYRVQVSKGKKIAFFYIFIHKQKKYIFAKKYNIRCPKQAQLLPCTLYRYSPSLGFSMVVEVQFRRLVSGCVLYKWIQVDRAERHDLKSRLRLFFSPFLFPPKKEGKRKGK